MKFILSREFAEMARFEASRAAWSLSGYKWLRLIKKPFTAVHFEASVQDAKYHFPKFAHAQKAKFGFKRNTAVLTQFSSAFSPTLFLRFSFDRRNVDPLGTDDVGGSEANGLSKRPGGVGGGGVLPYISYIGMCRPIG